MSKMTPSLLLIISVVVQFQGITGQNTINPLQKLFCDFDAFLSSKPVNGKVFMVPALKVDREGDWWEGRNYCARNCAEMVTIRNAEENRLFIDFMTEFSPRLGVWLGAETIDRQPFTKWINGDDATYQPIAPGEYNDAGHACVSNYNFNQLGFCNDICWGIRYIACQRNENATLCE